MYAQTLGYQTLTPSVGARPYSRNELRSSTKMPNTMTRRFICRVYDFGEAVETILPKNLNFTASSANRKLVRRESPKTSQ